MGCAAWPHPTARALPEIVRIRIAQFRRLDGHRRRLVFIAAAMDDRLRAFDIETGKVIWEGQLPGQRPGRSDDLLGERQTIHRDLRRRPRQVGHEDGRSRCGFHATLRMKPLSLLKLYSKSVCRIPSLECGRQNKALSLPSNSQYEIWKNGPTILKRQQIPFLLPNCHASPTHSLTVLSAPPDWRSARASVEAGFPAYCLTCGRM